MARLNMLIAAEKRIATSVAMKANVMAERVDILFDGNGLDGRSVLSILISK
jgi:hypothetical protein